MYKNFSIEDIKNVKNEFIPHLYNIIKREKCQWINDLVKIIFKEWKKLYYFDRWEPFFKIAQKWDNLELSDEIEKIQLTIPMNDKSKIQDLLKHYIMKKERQTWQKSIEEILFDEFKAGNFMKSYSQRRHNIFFQWGVSRFNDGFFQQVRQIFSA